jgi:anti-sigma B factor antagonist
MSGWKIATKAVGAKLAIVEVSGALDAHTNGELEAELRRIIAKGRVKIIMKLDGLDYIASAGAGVLVGAAGLAREKGGDLVLLGPKPHVREVFDLLGLSQMFEIAEDKESAIAALT